MKTFAKVNFQKWISWKRCLYVTKIIYTPIVLLFILSIIFKNYDLFSNLLLKTNFIYLFLVIIGWIILHFLAPMLAFLFLRANNYLHNYLDILEIYISRLPAKYIPGGIWHTVARMHDYHTLGITKKDITLLALFETIFPIPLTLCLGLFLIKCSGVLPIPPKFALAIFSLSVLSLSLPFFVNIHIWPHKEKSRRYYFIVVFISVVFWLIASYCFLLYLYSFPINNQYSFLSTSGPYIFSWGAGYLSIFAPQGIGVFEIVMAKIIDLPINLGSSVALIAGYRIVILLADLIVFVGQLLIKSILFNRVGL